MFVFEEFCQKPNSKTHRRERKPGKKVKTIVANRIFAFQGHGSIYSVNINEYLTCDVAELLFIFSA